MQQATDRTELAKRANAGDLTAAFDLNLQHAPDAATTQGLRPLPMVPVRQRIKPEIERTMKAVDPKLVAVFRKLAIGEARWPLYLWGPSGTGKTRAALALCDFVRWADYYTIDSVIEVLKGERNETQCQFELQADDCGFQHESHVRRSCGNLDLAVFDELGAQSANEFHYRAVRWLADRRDERPGREAIYTSNCSPEELQAVYDDRICSRVLCGTVFELVGDDRRFAGFGDIDGRSDR